MSKITDILLNLLILTSLFAYAMANYSSFGSLTDFSRCKVSHLGTEYEGNIAKTDSGVRCQKWQTDTFIHKVNENYVDDKFPEFSKKLANNYCRNPSFDPKGPWCYTMDVNLINETCGLPLCIFLECRVTGPGIEYGGQHNRSLSGKKCLRWNKARTKIKYKDSFIKQDTFEKEMFPDNNINEAKKFCRNPNGNVAGPWCYVESEDSDMVEQELCDIPFCDEEDCTFFSKDNPTYSHYLRFNDSLTNLTFGLKAWSSDSILNASARLILAVLPLPLNAKQIEDIGIGIEIHLTNKLSALTFGNKDEPEYYETHDVLKSTRFTFLSLTWSKGFITLSKHEKSKPIFVAQYKTKKNLLGYMKNSFFYYATRSTNILWSMPFCDDDGDCDVHTTTSLKYQNFWLLREHNLGYDLHFYVRAFHSAHILLVSNPLSNFPYIEIMFDRLTNNNTQVVSVEYEGAPKTLHIEYSFYPLLNYWKWTEFSISFFSNTLQVYLTNEVGTHMIMELKHDLFRKMRWFSPSSENTVAHWTFYCNPPPQANEPEAWPPECTLHSNEFGYKGSQWITYQGFPCLPWSGIKLLPESAAKAFSTSEAIKSINYCRNPDNKMKGTYCYTIDQKMTTIKQVFCHIRQCKSTECKMAGTGNDYIGKQNITRSNRNCTNWIQFIVNNNITHNYLNETLYADMSVEHAENFCRNPSRDIAGPWCYTTQNGTKDICNIRDCNKPEECTILLNGNNHDRNVYILLQWKITGLHGGLHFSLKMWNPDEQEGIIFEIKSLNSSQIINLIIGDDDNQKILLLYNNKLIKHKSFNHLLSGGKWTSFWLQVRKGEIFLGYEGVPFSLFEWHEDNSLLIFEPVFITYSTITTNPIAIHFKCEECHAEVTTTSKLFDKIMPLGLWSTLEKLIYDNLIINIRGFGIPIITLMVLPNSKEYYSIVFNTTKNEISFFETKNSSKKMLSSNTVNETLIKNDFWTVYELKFLETNLYIYRDSVLIYNSSNLKTLFFYWFSVAVLNGTITWTANCDPPDIDGKPIDGGWSHWSSWQCAVSCGGGEGYRTRTCTNPTPNIFGKLCEGSSMSIGVCNDFQCGDISSEVLEKIKDDVQSNQYSFVVAENDYIVIENNKNALRMVSEQSPESFYEWTLNGKLVTKSNRITIMNDNIIISHVSVGDMGVYVCMLHRINKQKLVLRVVSLAVTTDYYRIVTRASRDLILETNAVVLGYIFQDLHQKWILNNITFIDYGITTLAAVNVEYIKSLNMTHTGTWKCVIEQPYLQLSWITNIIKIQIIEPPNLYNHLREDNLTAPIFSWLKTDRNVHTALIFIELFTFSVVAMCLCAVLKWGTLPKKQMKSSNGRK